MKNLIVIMLTIFLAAAVTSAYAGNDPISKSNSKSSVKTVGPGGYGPVKSYSKSPVKFGSWNYKTNKYGPGTGSVLSNSKSSVKTSYKGSNKKFLKPKHKKHRRQMKRHYKWGF